MSLSYSDLLVIRTRLRYYDRKGLDIPDVRQELSRLVVNDFIADSDRSWFCKELCAKDFWDEVLRKRNGKFPTDGKFEGPPVPGWLKRFLREFEDCARRGRIAWTAWRLEEEMALAAAEGWYVVMDTLTFDRDSYEDFADGCTRRWKNYIQNWRYLVGVQYAGSRSAMRRIPATDYLRYACCVEKGDRTGRIHMHCLLFLRVLPVSMQRDPNLGYSVPKYRELVGAKQLWPWGFSTPVAVRLGPQDAYARLGWRWPVDRKTGKEVRYGSPGAVAGYLVKYLLKASNLTGEYRWRFRMSRGLGQGRVMKFIRSIPLRFLRPLSEIQTGQVLVKGRYMALPVPIRRLCRMERWSRLLDSPHREMVKTKFLASPGLNLIGFIKVLREVILTCGQISAAIWLTSLMLRKMARSDRRQAALEWIERSLDDFRPASMSAVSPVHEMV